MANARDLAPIHTTLEGVGHVLRDYRLTVPPYQRSYSWEDGEVSDFWWDLRAAFRSKAAQYFLGTIVLTGAGDGARSITDGQQRLATTTLLIAAIRDEFNRRGDVHRASVVEREYILTTDLRTARLEPRIRLNEEDQPLFEAALTDGSTPQSASPEVLEGSKLGRALAFFQEQFAAEAREAGPHWGETLIQWIDFVESRARVITVEVADEADAFLIFETLNDRGRELTIADLLKNYLFGVSRDDLAPLQESWTQTVHALRASADEEILTTYLRHFWSSLYGATRERELYGKIKARISAPARAVEFTSLLASDAPLYAAMLDTDAPYWSERPAARAANETLLRLGLEQYRPLLLAGLRRFDDGEALLLLRALIAWSVRGLIVGGIGGGTTEKAYGEAAVAVSEGDARDTAAVFQELSHVIPSDDDFHASFVSKRINRTTVAKYLLAALSRHEERIDDAAILSEAEDAQVLLSHRMPRNSYPEDWPEFNPEELGQWALRLGNLAITDRLTEESGPNFEGFSATPWTPAAVGERQSDLADTAVLVWPRRGTLG